jgi:signal transduction histidine kinase
MENLQKRAGQIGATLTVSSEAWQGTRISIEFALQ